jgi:hypothetical protein
MVIELVKLQGIRFNLPPPFFLMVTSSNPLAVVAHKLDVNKNELLSTCTLVGYGDRVAFPDNSYSLNRTFHSR